MKLSSTRATSKLFILVVLLLGLTTLAQTQNPCDDAGCVQCNAGRTACISCYTDHYLLSGRCYKCGTGCQTCSGSANNCGKCELGYRLSGTSCQACTPGCLICSSTAVDGCQACDKSFFESRGTCVKCPENCTECTGANSCTACKPGFDEFSSKCDPKATTPPSKGLQGGAIAGIVIGGVALIVIIGVCIYCINKKPKKSTAEFLAGLNFTPQPGTSPAQPGYGNNGASMGLQSAAMLPPGFTNQGNPMMQPMGYGQPYQQPSGQPAPYSVPLQAQPPLFAKA